MDVNTANKKCNLILSVCVCTCECDHVVWQMNIVICIEKRAFVSFKRFVRDCLLGSDVGPADSSSWRARRQEATAHGQHDRADNSGPHEFRILNNDRRNKTQNT